MRTSVLYSADHRARCPAPREARLLASYLERCGRTSRRTSRPDALERGRANVLRAGAGPPLDETAYPAVIAALDDGDPRVREEALHALACDRCKDNACRPEKADVLPRGMQLLRTDPDRRVRAFAAEVVARWVHTDADAAAALVEASRSDPDPTVRKKATWYAPGGTIHRKTRPKTSAAASRTVQPFR